MKDKGYINHLAHLALVANSDGMEEHHDSIVVSVGYLRRYTDKLISDHKAVVETKDNRILELEKEIKKLEELKESMLERSCKNCGLFGEGCEDHCDAAGLCFCHDWTAKGIK